MKFKGILRNTLWMLAGTVLWCSCYDERVMDEVPVVGEDMTISFISNPMQRYQVTSRASDAKEDDEKRINQLYIFFFDADGNYLNGTYLTGYDDASARETGGYLAPGQGVSLVKIDKEGFRTDDEKNKAKTATVYVVANVEPALFRDVDDAGRPVNFRDMAALEEYMYSPSGELSIGLPRNGMPMVGKATMDLTGESTPAEDRIVEMKALMARVDVNIQLASETTDGQLPSFMLTDWSVVNLPTKVKLGDVTTTTGELGQNKTTEETPMQRVIYNRNGEITFSFYMFENIQEAKTNNPEWMEMGGKYPDSISLSQQQRYKPYLADKANATALKLHGFYTTYNDATYEVSYTLYLGANHTNDFKVKRNHQYKNDITITGLTAQSSTNGEYTLDARVNVEEENNKYYISMLRERNHDAHFCVTPMDVYFFDEESNPTMEVILGEVPDGNTTPPPETVPAWIRMERIDAEDMKNGTVSVSGFSGGDSGTHLDTGEPWKAGNGKRKYFTRNLVTSTLVETGKQVTIQHNRDRVYFYLDENLDTNPDGTVKEEDRRAIITLIYKENGEEKMRRTIDIVQTHLLPVTMRDGGTLYMEQYEEYLDHYDPLNEYSTEQIYPGLPWAEKNSGLDDFEIEQLLKDWYGSVLASPKYDPPGQIFNDGYPYASFIIFRANQGLMTLNDRPLSAFQYCHNKNKRDDDGLIPSSYRSRGSLLYGDAYQEISNESKWFLPGIRQMEDALTQYYTTFGEFQTNYYWSASAGERAGDTDGQNPERARATKAKSEGGYEESGGGGNDGWRKYAYELGNGGYALRTEILRIRAFRVDLKPMN